MSDTQAVTSNGLDWKGLSNALADECRSWQHRHSSLDRETLEAYWDVADDMTKAAPAQREQVLYDRLSGVVEWSRKERAEAGVPTAPPFDLEEWKARMIEIGLPPEQVEALAKKMES